MLTQGNMIPGRMVVLGDGRVIGTGQGVVPTTVGCVDHDASATRMLYDFV